MKKNIKEENKSFAGAGLEARVLPGHAEECIPYFWGHPRHAS